MSPLGLDARLYYQCLDDVHVKKSWEIHTFQAEYSQKLTECTHLSFQTLELFFFKQPIHIQNQPAL